MDTTQFVTKTDLKQAFDELEKRMQKMVGEVVGTIVGEAMQVISERFDKVEAQLERMESRHNSLETKFDAVQDTTDHHSIDIKALQRKVAKNSA